MRGLGHEKAHQLVMTPCSAARLCGFAVLESCQHLIACATHGSGIPYHSKGLKGSAKGAKGLGTRVWVG